MNLSSSEIEHRRTEIKSSWVPHPVGRNHYGTDQLENGIISGDGGERLRHAIEYYKNKTPELNIGCDDLIKSAIAFGNLSAVVELWDHIHASQREKMVFAEDNWGLALKYRQDHIVEYLIKTHPISECSSARALKDLAPWASLNTLRLAAGKYRPRPSMCASALLEACISPREDVMEFLAHLSGREALKKMQYGIANPQIAELFEDSQNIEKVRVFNAFVQKIIVSNEINVLKMQSTDCDANSAVRKI